MSEYQQHNAFSKQIYYRLLNILLSLDVVADMSCFGYIELNKSFPLEIIISHWLTIDKDKIMYEQTVCQ